MRSIHVWIAVSDKDVEKKLSVEFFYPAKLGVSRYGTLKVLDLDQPLFVVNGVGGGVVAPYYVRIPVKYKRAVEYTRTSRVGIPVGIVQ